MPIARAFKFLIVKAASSATRSTTSFDRNKLASYTFRRCSTVDAALRAQLGGRIIGHGGGPAILAGIGRQWKGIRGIRQWMLNIKVSNVRI